MKRYLFTVLSLLYSGLSAQQAYIGKSTIELITYNGEAAILQEVSMPFGYKTSCPKIVSKEIVREGSDLVVRVEYDATGYNLACGCMSRTTILLNGYTNADLKEFDKIVVHSDVRYDPNGEQQLFEDEDVQILFRGESLLSNEFYALNDVKVYPNPAVNVLNLEIPTTVEVKDIYITSGSGALVGRLSSTSRMLDLQGYAPGQYYVWIVGSTERVVRSFIVSK